MPVRAGSLWRPDQPESSATRDQHVAHAAGVEIAQRIWRAGGIHQHARLAQQCQAERDRVLPGLMRQLVDE